MKYLKLQQEIIKEANKDKDLNCKYFEIEEDIYIVPSPHCFMMVIPKKSFFLDKNKIFKESDHMDLSKFIGGSKNAKLAKNEKITVESDKKKLRLFTIDDEKYLKYFDEDISTFSGTNKKSSIYIWEKGKLVGLILPVRKDW